MLTFNLKKEWFNKIKSGEKTHEYREVKQYWTKRINKTLGLNDNDFVHALGSIPVMCIIHFVNGYNPKNGELSAFITNVSITSGLNTDLKINKPVYDIEFELLQQDKVYYSSK